MLSPAHVPMVAKFAHVSVKEIKEHVIIIDTQGNVLITNVQLKLNPGYLHV